MIVGCTTGHMVRAPARQVVGRASGEVIRSAEGQVVVGVHGRHGCVVTDAAHVSEVGVQAVAELDVFAG
ncbi:hypothetical protein AQI95_37350, partial [Streptomyces yokosukanensis]